MSSQTDVLFQRILTTATTRGASDVHLSAGQPPYVRIDGSLLSLEEEGVLSPAVLDEVLESLLDDPAKQELAMKKRVAIARSYGARLRLKAVVEYQQGYPAISLHLHTSLIPSLKELGLPKVVEELTQAKKGLVLMIGPYGSGRTTAIAAFLNAINMTRVARVVSLEQPVEYLLTPQKSYIEQQEVGRDTPSFIEGLHALREGDVEVVAVSALDHYAVFEELLTLIEGGRLGIASVEAENAVQALELLTAPFSAHERERVLHTLADVLVAVVGLRLLPRVGGGRVQVAEVLVMTAPVRVLVRDGKLGQVSSWMTSSREGGTVSLDRALAELVKTGEVLLEDALSEVSDKETFQRLVQARQPE